MSRTETRQGRSTHGRPEPLIRRTPGERLRALPRSVIWFVGAVAFTIAAGLVLFPLAAVMRPERRYWIFAYGWSFPLLHWTRLAAGIRWEVEGEGHIPERPCVIMAKHQSAWETIGLQLWFNPQSWVLKRELLHLPLVGWALRMIEPIAIDRGARRQAMAQLLEQGAERLAAGRWVMIYPEGTRIPAGRSVPYRRGGALLAWETGYPVIPVAHNAGEVWPRNGFLKYPGTIRVCIGPPMVPREEETPEAFLERIRQWIEGRMRAISTVYEAPEQATEAESGKD